MIYVVDDESILLELAREILEAEGYDVKTFRDPSQALQAFRRARRKPELILTDYHMRSMNGLELTTACRNISPSLKIGLVSGTVDKAICNDTDEQPNEFLSKPYKQHELTRMVNKLVG